MITRGFVFLAFAMALVASGANAQTTTGSITGTVKDNTGGVLPGVSVTVTGENVVGAQVAATNNVGFFRVIGLPPGAYKVRLEFPTFGALEYDLRVGVGDASNITAEMTPALEEQITVTAEAAVVDLRSTQVDSNFDAEFVRNAPLRRFTFFDLINAAPGVNQSNSASSRSTVLGSSTDENSYQMDGTDFTAPLTGAAWPWPNTDAIEEIEVLSLGAPAEYGNVAGAVFNVVTRQGSNTFHGDVNFYLQSENLTGRNTTDEQDSGNPYSRERFNDFTTQFSGPVIKDKLWFFGSYQYQRDHDAPTGVPSEFFTRNDNDRIFLKGNWQVNDSNKIQVSYHNDYYFLPWTPSANTAPSTIAVESGSNPTPNVSYTGVLSENTLVEARYSGFYGSDHGDPIIEGQPRIQPRFYDLDTGQITGGTYLWYDSNIWKTAVNAKVTHFADDFLGGSHDFKFGVQYNRGGSEAQIGYNDFIYTYEYYGYKYAYGYKYQPYSYGGIVTGVGVFLDDTFRVNDRLTLSLGLRFDRNRASIPEAGVLDQAGNPTGVSVPAVGNLYTWNSIAPRLGFNFDLTGDGKTSLKAHYGRYYRGVITGEFALALGASPNSVFGGPFDLETNEFIDLTEFESSRNRAVDDNYLQPYTDQFIIGFERELTRDFAVSLNYAHKRGRDYPAWQDTAGVYQSGIYVDDQGQDATGQAIPIQILVSDPADRFFTMSNPDIMKTDIDAFTIQGTKRMRDNWQLSGSLVYQRMEGALPSSRSGARSAQAGSLVFNSFGQNPNDFINATGRLIGERPWTFKTQLVYNAPAGIVFGMNYLWQTGRPWARRIRVPDTGLTTEILAEPVDGSRRVSSWNVMDIRVQKDFSITDTVRFGVFGDVFNLFNDDAHEDVLARLGTAEIFGLPDGYLIPRRLQVGVKLRF